MTDWTTADIPYLSGKTAVVTGATGGLGYETAMALAGAGAIVILTGRNDAKGLREGMSAMLQSVMPYLRSGLEKPRDRSKCALGATLQVVK